MIDEKLIDRWVKEKTINKNQAKKMLSDVVSHKKESRSNKFIIAISTIGAILLGIGAILFIASNWQELSKLAKTLILIGSTALAYYAGYYFKFQKQNLPKVGASLLFLGALLFGATVILVTQIYNVNAHNHVLILIWLIGILPLVYAASSAPTAGLASLLFFIWMGELLADEWWFFEDLGRFSIILFISGAMTLFAIGGMHKVRKGLEGIGRVYRLVGIKVLMFCLFLLTFEWFSKLQHGGMTMWYANTLAEIKWWIVAFFGIALVASLVNWHLNRSESLSLYEGPISIGLIALLLVFFFVPSVTTIYMVIFNLLLFAMIILLLYLGYHRGDIALVNIGMFWLAVFLVAKYFDWFWDLLERSVFFLIGGLILVVGGIFLERGRRRIKGSFK